MKINRVDTAKNKELVRKQERNEFVGVLKQIAKSTQTLLPYFQYCYSCLNVFPKSQKYEDDSLNQENVINVCKADTSIFRVSSLSCFIWYVTFGEKKGKNSRLSFSKT